MAASATRPSTAAPRRLHFNSFPEVLAEVESLHARPHRQLGNWPLPVAVGHLASGMEASIEGGTFPVRWYLKILGPLFIKRRLLNHRFPAGFRLPRAARERLIPRPEIGYEEAYAHLQRAIARLGSETQRGTHPVLGKLTIDEWNRFHLRHAELHLGYLVPE